MTDRLCVFLRGINVGSIQIKMDALKAAFMEMGFAEPHTLLATGNVLITPPQNKDRAALKALIEQELSARFRYDAHVLLRDHTQIAALITAAQAVDVPDNTHIYALLCQDTGLPEELEALYGTRPHVEGEQFHALETDALWIVPKGETLGSDFGSKVLGSRKYKSRLTSRNIHTVAKIHTLMTL